MKSFLDKHKLFVDIAVTVLLCAVMLIAMEIRQPYFFLQDDNCDSYICQYAYSLRSVSQGEFPYYDFHQFGGMRFLDKGQTGQLNIFVYLAGALSELLLGHIGGVVDFSAAIYLILGAVGMLFLLQKRFKVKSAVSIIGAITWSFNSFSIYCGSNWMITLILTGCLPWIVLSTCYLMDNDELKALILAAIPKVFMFYGGHPQYFIYAIIFDYLFALSYLLFVTAKGSRLKALGKFTLKYFLSGLLILLWSLPLLVPMYEMMISSVDRSSVFDWITFSEYTFPLKDLLTGMLYPLFQFDVTGVEVIDGVEVPTIVCVIAILKNMSYIGYLLLFTALFGLVHLLFGRDKKNSLYSASNRKQLFAMIPPALIALFWGGTTWFNRIIFFIPILNRFRFPFKVIQFFLFFLIMFACVALNAYVVSKKGNNILPVVLIAVQCVNLTAVYLILPVRFFGVYTNSPVPYEEPWAEDLKDKRYVTVLDHPDYFGVNLFDEDGNSAQRRIAYDTTAVLSNNIATYFGFDNISGYEILNNRELYEANGDMLSWIDDVGGNIADVYDGMVEQMRDRAVSLYVTLPEYADYVERRLAPYGIVRWKEDDNRVIFYDAEAEPRAYYSDSNEEFGEVQLDVHVNYLEVTTPSDFEGGSVTVNYIHDSAFVATVDGQEMPITNCGNYSDMIVNGVDAGEHTIIFRFVDNSFRNCLIFSGIITVLLAAGLLVSTKVKNKEN